MKGNLYLIGFMGVGKSYVGRTLSELLSLPLLDSDREIEKEEGMTIPEIFESRGEEAFRDMETVLLERLKKASPVILSCGGGMVLREENRRLMKESGKTICLTASPETIYERVRFSTNRPLLKGRMNPEAIGELMEERRERYERAADFTLSTDGKSGSEIAEEIQQILEASSQPSGSAS